MRNIKDCFKNGHLLYKITGEFQFKKEIFKKGRVYLPPFTTKVNKVHISIVLSYIDSEHPNVLFIKEMYLNPNIFTLSELNSGLNNRSPYFETLANTLNIFLKTFNLTFKEYDINKISYKVYTYGDYDMFILEVLKWFGFKKDAQRTIQEYELKTKWREHETLPFYIFTKVLV